MREIDERVKAFLNRPLEGDWPYLWLDATYVKVRQVGRIVSVAVIIAVAVNAQGRREVLGITVMPSEAETFWTEFLRSLTRRGLRGVKLVISDAHEGLKAAAAKVLGASWQRCRVHFMRNALACVGKRNRAMVAAALRNTFEQPNREVAREQWNKLLDAFAEPADKLAKLMREAEDDVFAYMAFQRTTGTNCTPPSTRATEQRNQAAHECYRHLPRRRCHHPSRWRSHARAKRRVGCHAPLHEPGNRRPSLRRSNHRRRENRGVVIIRPTLPDTLNYTTPRGTANLS